MSEAQPSIFQQYFADDQQFVDRLATDERRGLDVLIPVIHSNELWRANLLSIYREVPVRRLLLGDGGCIDDTIAIARQFPRVEVFDHRTFQTLGYSIRKLIEEVTSDWFIYLHSDVYLPPGWFDGMTRYQPRYDWFECRQQLTVLAEYPHDYSNYYRPLSGSQMGRKAAFKEILPIIQDDYLYRNEDQIIAEMLRNQGARYGRVDEVFHYHQMMFKKSAWQRKIKKVSFEVEKSPSEAWREAIQHIQSIVAYTQPNPVMIASLQSGLIAMKNFPQFHFEEFEQWVKHTRPIWLDHVRKKSVARKIIDRFVRLLHGTKKS